MNTDKTKGAFRKRWRWIIGAVLLLFGLWQLLTGIYGEEEKKLRRQLREKVIATFPEQNAKFSQTVGLFFYETDKEVAREVAPERKAVVLIHGLDDPGKVWQNLAPELVKADFNVWLMHYPNDQPIAASARLLSQELQKLPPLGIHRIFIVAHSMGGLVAREMLTHPAIDYFSAARSKQVPEVAMLIMVGTPNHGSQLARLRVLAEWRDHLVRLSKGEAQWLGGILDGAGEAKIDLLPDSRFLTALNARPHPQGISMLVIAGITSPWNDGDIQRWMDSLRPKVPDELQPWVDELGANMISMTHGLGDGLVSVESARLAGVALRTVEGTHLSMIRNIAKDSRRTPPAVPIIVDRLQSEEIQ